MTSNRDYATENASRFRDQLFELLRIPSISTADAYKEDVRRAAEWLVNDLQSIGLTAELIETEKHPLVYAEWLDAGEDAKTVLFYGHYDVQPADKEDGWDTEPFEPVEKDGFVYARGATDDKGQMFTHVKAVESLLKQDGKLPVNVKFIIEGEEESGGQSIASYIREHGDRLKADVCVISDTSMADMSQPVIINALRGALSLELTITGPKQDLHSGMYGGTVHNPLQALAEMITMLHDDDGRVTVPGFYDNVRELTEADKDAINSVSYTNVEWAEDTGALLPWGEREFTLLERIGARPTLEITGMAGGYYGDGSKSIIPAKAVAKISCRLVADQDPAKIQKALIGHLTSITPATVTSSVKVINKAVPAVLINTDAPAMNAAVAAYNKAWGTAPIFMREGGSIPVVADLQSLLEMPVILMGFGLNSDGLHGPNEHFSLEMFQRGIKTSMQFMNEMANLSTQGEDA